MHTARTITLLLLVFGLTSPVKSQSVNQQQPLRVGVAGLTHAHVHWILGREDRGDVEIVGIAEADRELAQRYADQHGYSMDLVYSSLEEMLDKTKPEAVVAFNSIYGHLSVVEACAPLGIHVMVEKPLAVNAKHARKMEKLAKEHDIHLLTNYETTWYATHAKSYEMIHDESAIGPLRKVVIHDGHPGPIEIGCNVEFLEWLTDPVLNGGGALTDFGCYGANLMTWLMRGERPLSVQAITQQIKPHRYPKVDDEATILVKYAGAQAIIQASWNWPFSRKDMHMYGQTGALFADNRSDLRFRPSEKEAEKKMKLPELKAPYDDPFSYLNAVVKGEIEVESHHLSALENNLLVVEILDAARKSAKSGKAVRLRP